MSRKNPFADEPAGEGRVNPFGEESAAINPAVRMEQAARKIRNLRSQLGAEGLTVPATRELIDEVAAALEAAARALREKS